MATALEKKRENVPLPLLSEIVNSALDRLGYSPKKEPTTAVQVNVNSQQVVAPVSAEALGAARETLRLVEQRKLELPSRSDSASITSDGEAVAAAGEGETGEGISGAS